MFDSVVAEDRKKKDPFVYKIIYMYTVTGSRGLKELLMCATTPKM